MKSELLPCKRCGTKPKKKGAEIYCPNKKCHSCYIKMKTEKESIENQMIF